MKQVNYVERNSLMQRDSTRSIEDLPVDTWLTGDLKIIIFEENHSEFGCDACALYPAFVNGKKAFHVIRNWDAAHGYCAEGVEEELISFSQGVKLLVRLGAYEWIFKN